jgi:hypothetical protein
MRRARYLAVTAVLIAGCGESTLDTAELESEIVAGIEKQTATRDAKADCPDDVELKKDDVFTCEVTAPGGVKAPVEVTQTDDDGNVRWRLAP